MIGPKVGLVIFGVFFFAVFIAASIFHYVNKYKSKYSIKNMFPYEFNYNSPFVENFWGNISFIAYTGIAIAFHYTCLLNPNDGIGIALNIAMTIASLFALFLLFIPLRYIRLHSVIAILSIVFSFLSSALLSIYGFKLNNTDNNMVYIVVFALAAVIALIQLVVIANPKLSMNFQYDTKKNDDGSVTYIRPKYIVMAFSEWIIILLNSILFILSFVLSMAL